MTDKGENSESEGITLSGSAGLLDGLRLGGVGVWRWKVDSDDLRWTANLEAVHALPEGSFDGTLSSFRNDIHPDDTDLVWRVISETLESGGPYKVVYRTAPREDAPTRWIEATGGLLPAADDGGGDRFLTGICLDITERVMNERELERRLRQQKAIERLSSFALSTAEFQAVLDKAVQIAAEVLEVPLTKILQFGDAADHLKLVAGIGWKEGLVGRGQVGIDSDSQAGYTLQSRSPVVVADLRTETRFHGPPLLVEYGVRSGISVVIAGTEERPFGVFGIHTTRPRTFEPADVDFLTSLANIVASSNRQHMASAQRVLLMRELTHRSGNILQIVNAIANQTFPVGEISAGAKQAFSERLGSLARANYLIAQGGWTQTRLRSVLEESLAPFRKRINLRGRDILLPPDLCFDLGLVVHELATNSVKYGTLGQASGEVEISWDIAEGENGEPRFRLEWRDARSRPVANGSSSGFGSKFIASIIERKWNGTLAIATDDGYRFACEIPLSQPTIADPLTTGS